MQDNKATTVTWQIPEWKIKPKIIPKFADCNFFLFFATIKQNLRSPGSSRLKKAFIVHKPSTTLIFTKPYPQMQFVLVHNEDKHI